MSQVTWNYGEVVLTDNAFRVDTAKPDRKNPKTKGGTISPAYRGEIEVILSAGGPAFGASGVKIIAYPANINLTRIPLVGEHVMCFQGPGKEAGPGGPDQKTGETEQVGQTFDLEWYYLDPLALQGSIHTNLNPGANVGTTGNKEKGKKTTKQDGETKSTAAANETVIAGNPTTNEKAVKDNAASKVQNTADTPPGKDFKEQTGINNLQPYEGDIIVQGRHGQSIRLGSSLQPSAESDKNKRYFKMPTWAPGGSGEQGPIVIIRSGQGESNTTNDYVIEKVNSDKASLYVCSGQKIPIAVASPDFNSLDENLCRSGNDCNYSSTDESGNTIPTNSCNATGGQIVKTDPNAPIPTSVEELPLLDGDYPYFNTSTGKEVGRMRLRVIDKMCIRESFCENLLNMMAAAKKAGHKLSINSGYRGIRNTYYPKSQGGKYISAGQLDLRKQNAIDRSWRTDAQMKDKKSKLWKARSKYFKNKTAAPGFSKHQDGSGLDLNWGSSTKHSKSGRYAWLLGNSYKFGYVRTVPSEEWHFEYNPKKAAKGTFGGLSKSSSNRWHGHEKYL
tara:strand:+ start:3962 stop:5641 length:1680 start_codon:yes stop_codon:yes gene_type:complete